MYYSHILIIHIFGDFWDIFIAILSNNKNNFKYLIFKIIMTKFDLFLFMVTKHLNVYLSTFGNIYFPFSYLKSLFTFINYN
jgi:hypothetical protein